MDEHPIFGKVLALEELSKERFPTELELLNVIRGLKNKVVKPNGTIERTDSINLYTSVANLLTEIWKSACIQVPELKHGRETLESHFDYILSHATKNPKKILKSPDAKNAYLEKLKKVYNYSACICFVSRKNVYKVNSMEEVIKSKCKCENPILSLELYADQLFGRSLTIWVSEEIKARFKELQGNHENYFLGIRIIFKITFT